MLSPKSQKYEIAFCDVFVKSTIDGMQFDEIECVNPAVGPLTTIKACSVIVSVQPPAEVSIN